ncbi:formate dehydrogenase [Pyrobaculum neutrophilum]|uniref:Formate dehydrogenase protein FdhE n=1 Tax=Pyrobaculum neutrophilum (strain DSM 2338 / JCM 9278 / NBRC 100436 / V24Sta) TaxID=444157 RepID=B1YDX1_PYRNV|nr:formate dehydrogenase [Pyrobaculum neutrophilum]ACB39984.1 formate dehydrogenase protein FdhE [Pyrobaculum neutrophilum V24Sta]
MEPLYRALCGEDQECLREARETPRFLSELDQIARGLEIHVDRPGQYAVESVDVERLRREAEGRGVPRQLVDYVVRRALYFRFGSGGVGGRCKNCGDPASLIVLRREDLGIYERHRPYARCICGSEWEFELWRCPNCGASGRDSFDVYIYGGVHIYSCRKCGYRFGVVEDRPDLHTTHFYIHMLRWTLPNPRPWQ